MSLDLTGTQIRIPHGIIDLGLGDPQFDLLPLGAIEHAARAWLAKGDPAALQYGAEQGSPRLRALLAETLAPAYGSVLDPGSLMITNGASQALDLICSLFTRPGQEVWVEEPTYFLALRIFRDHGLKPVGLPVDEHGLIIAEVARRLQQGERPAFLYTIPTFQNPSGLSLSGERRQELAGLSQAYELLVVADEVYHLLWYASPPPPALAAWCMQAPILSLGSFTKILAPGLRLGWLVASPALLARLVGCGLLASGGGLNPFSSAIVSELIACGDLTANITRLRQVYSTRVELVDGLLRAHLPGLSFSKPQGGFFFWTRLPGGLDAEMLLEPAQKERVAFRPGVRFSASGELKDYLRLCFTFYPEEILAEGIKRLARVIG